MYYTIIQIYFGKLYNVNIPNYLNNQILFNNNNKLYLLCELNMQITVNKQPYISKPTFSFYNH